MERDENLRMIADSVDFLTGRQKVVVYDAEHFFDGWRDDRDYALRCLRAASEAGAAYLVLCDTNGASLPHEIEAPPARSSRSCPTPGSASTATTTPRSAWRTRSPACAPAPAWSRAR